MGKTLATLAMLVPLLLNLNLRDFIISTTSRTHSISVISAPLSADIRPVG